VAGKAGSVMAKVAVKPGVSTVLAENIYDTLKEDILNSVLEPEAVLDEVNLMARFDVSRTPVREAIRRLIATGLVNMEPHRSAYVRPLSVVDIADFFEAYTLVQRIVFILSASRIARLQLERASKIQDRLEAACKVANIKAVRDLNLQFHSAIAEGCGNKYLQESYAKVLEDSVRLSSLLLRFTVDTDWRAHAAGIQRDHTRIISALAKNDTAAVAQYSDQHVAFFKEQVYRAIEKQTPKEALLDPSYPRKRA
jgi:DNA-binding GntR family transcriptional regulator